MEKYLYKFLDQNPTDYLEMSIQYLTLIAPGGNISDKAKLDLKEKFRKLNSGNFSSNFDKIDDIFNRFTNSSDYNPEKYVQEFVGLLNYGKIWINNKKISRFMNPGFYAS